jgi:hypothetical protein
MVSELEMLIGNDYKKLDKYNYDVRGDIENRLLRIMRGTYLDENSTKEIYKTIIKYNGKSSLRVAEYLENAAYKLRNKDAVIEISRTVGRYGKETAPEIALWLREASVSLKNKSSVAEINRILSLDEIVNTVEKYGKKSAPTIAYCLGEIAYDLKDKDAVIEISRTVGRYGKETAPEIALWLRKAVYSPKDKNAVVEISDILSLDEIVNTTEKYGEKVALTIANYLAGAAYKLRNKDAVIEISRTVGRYGKETAPEIAKLLGRVVYSPKDKNAVVKINKILSLDEIVNTVEKYRKEAAPEIAKLIIDTVLQLRDKDKMLRACRLIGIGEREFTRRIEPNDLENVLNEGLDRLVKDKSTLNAVLTYNSSNGELPKPNESNIDNYGSVVMSHLNDKYGVKKPLNLSQTVLFYSTSSEKRNEMTNYINSSAEKNPVFYSMNGINDDNDSIRYSKEELKKYSVISIIGSRNKETEAEARKTIGDLIGDKKVNRGKSIFYSKYKTKLPEIIELVKNRDYAKAYAVLSNLNNENISDVLNSSNYRDYGSLNDGVIRAVESKNPLDYDRSIQMACVYLPGAAEEGISEYCKDDNVILVKYEIGGESLGSAICYKEGDKFLVDSIEGHRRFRKSKIYDIVYDDLLMRAKGYGAKEVLFGLDALNETPIDFSEHLSGKHLSKIRVKMALNTEAYLETNAKSMAYSVMI